MALSQRFCCCLGAAEHDRVAAEERGEHAGRDADVDRGHQFAHAVHVEGAAAHPAVRLGDEQQRDAELVAAHPAHDRLGELVGGVQLQQFGFGQFALGKCRDGVDHHLERLEVNSFGHAVRLRFGGGPMCWWPDVLLGGAVRRERSDGPVGLVADPASPLLPVTDSTGALAPAFHKWWQMTQRKRSARRGSGRDPHL